MTVETTVRCSVSGKVKTNMFGGLNCMQFVSVFGFFLIHGHWPMVRPYGEAEGQ